MTEQEIEDLEIAHLLRVYRPDFRTPELKEEIRQKLERRGLLRRDTCILQCSKAVKLEIKR